MTDQKINDLLAEIHKTGSHKIKNSSEFRNSIEYDGYRDLIFIKMKDELKLLIPSISSGLSLSDKGLRISENDGWIKHLKSEKERQDFEFEKSKIDFKLAKETLNELPRTKMFAVVGFIIAAVLALKELGIWIWQLCCQ